MSREGIKRVYDRRIEDVAMASATEAEEEEEAQQQQQQQQQQQDGEGRGGGLYGRMIYRATDWGWHVRGTCGHAFKKC